MKIAIGSDHVGFQLKMKITHHLLERGYEVADCGTDDEARCDYPVYGYRVAREVASGNCQRGILICGTGIGISLAANSVKGVRAAVCSESYSAYMARSHNDVHIIAFGARVVGEDVAKQIVDTFLQTAYEGGRHQKRLDMIEQIKQGGTVA